MQPTPRNSRKCSASHWGCNKSARPTHRSILWYPRFPRIGPALPDRILLVWPEFGLEKWQSASELFGTIGCRGGGPFTNRGSETLFEAAGRCAIDWDSRADNSAYDLSRFVRADYGYFANRDEAFQKLGQTLCKPIRTIADPLFRHIGA